MAWSWRSTPWRSTAASPCWRSPRRAGRSVCHHVVAAVEGLDEVARAEACDLVVQFLRPGDVVRGYPDFSGYPGFVLSHHRDTDEAARFHEWLDELIRVRYLPHAGPG